MSDQDREEENLLGRARRIRPSLRGRGGPPRYVKAAALSIPERLRVARGTPQAVAKITGFHRNRVQCRRHWTYISRRGTLPLETEQGEVLRDLAEQKEVLDAWALGFDIGKRSRNQMNYTVSAPKGASPEAVNKAARAFGQEVFAGHFYVFALHTDKAHPHVHFAVMLRGETKKLNPRLKDLHRWRERWAEHARAQGIEMACSPRATRGVGRRSPRSVTYQLQRRGITPQRTRQAAKEVAGNQTDTPWEQYVKARNHAERTAFRRSATELRTAATKLSPTERTKIETAATELEQFAAQMPVAKTRRQQMREALTKHPQQKSSIEKEHEDRER